MSTASLPLVWVDLLFLAVLSLSVIVGVVRGFLYETLSLLGWVVAWLAAQHLAPHLAPLLPVGNPGTALNHAAAFALAFVVVLMVWALLVRLIRALVHATPLSLVDRFLGAVFGFIRGAVVLLVVATLVGYTPASQSGPWQASKGARMLGEAMQLLKPLLPPQATRFLAA